MSEQSALTLLGIVGVIVGPLLVAALGLIVAQQVRQARRIGKLEHRERLWWLWTRSLVDHAYKYAPGHPLPAPPEELLEDTIST